MTLTQFLVAMADDTTINVTKDDVLIASFLKSTYQSISDTILAYTVSTFTVEAWIGGLKSIDVTVIE